MGGQRERMGERELFFTRLASARLLPLFAGDLANESIWISKGKHGMWEIDLEPSGLWINLKSEERSGVARSWEWEYVPAERCNTDVCLFTHISGGQHVVIGRLFVWRRVGCHFKCGQGQGNIAQNTMNSQGIKRNKIQNRIKRLKIHYWWSVPTAHSTSYWDIFTLHHKDDHWALQVICCLQRQ